MTPTILFPHIPIADILQVLLILTTGESPWLQPEEASKLADLGAEVLGAAFDHTSGRTQFLLVGRYNFPFE